MPGAVERELTMLSSALPAMYVMVMASLTFPILQQNADDAVVPGKLGTVSVMKL